MRLRPPEPPLADGVVVMRPPRADEADAVAAACSDPEIARWTEIPWPYEERHAVDFLAHVAHTWATGTEAVFVVTALHGGPILGMIGLTPAGPGIGRLGYWVAREARGRGTATRALVLVSRWGLGQGLDRVELLTITGNRASERVAEKAGFRPEGLLRAYIDQRGARRDARMWSLLPGDLRPEGRDEGGRSLPEG